MPIHAGGRGPGHISRYISGMTPLLDFNWGVVTSLDARITASGATNGTRVNSSGSIVSATTPRFDYNPTTLQAKGLLLEGARTNLILNSDDWSAVGWSKVNNTISTNFRTGPSGTATADKGTRGSTATSFTTESFTKAASALAYTGSVFTRGETGNYTALRLQGTYPARVDGTFNTSTGAIATAAAVSGSFTSPSSSIFASSNSFYREVISAVSDTATTVVFLMSHNSNNVHVDNVDSAANSAASYWGAQLEQASFVSSYIPTTTVALTRTADSVSMTGSNFSSWWDTNGGTVYLEADTPATGTRTIWQVDDGTANNRITIYTSGTSLKVTIVTGGVTQADITIGTISAYTVFKTAVSFQTNDIRAALNGVNATPDTSATLPTVNNCKFGASLTAGDELFGHIVRYKYFTGTTLNPGALTL